MLLRAFGVEVKLRQAGGRAHHSGLLPKSHIVQTVFECEGRREINILT